MSESLGLSERDYNNLKLLIIKYYKGIFNFLNEKNGKNPKNIDFIRLYFCLDEMKIITIYSHKGLKRKYHVEGVKYEDSKFDESLDYLILCNLKIEKFTTWQEFIKNYDDLEFTYGDRLKYLNNFIQVEYRNEIKLLKLDYLGL